MAEQAFHIVKSALKNRKAAQSLPPYLLLSDSTSTACTRAAGYLGTMRITAEEKEILRETKTVEDAEEIISCYVQEMTKVGSKSRIWKKVHAIAKFAAPVLEVFKQANFSPECSLAIGLVGLLLIQPLSNSSEIEERLELEVNQLSDILSQVKFNNSFVRTHEISAQIEGLCAAIVDFIVHALQYQKKWSIVKIMGNIVMDFTKRFQSLVIKVKGHANKIEVLAQRNYTTVLIESKDILDSTSQILNGIQSRIATQAAATSVALSNLQKAIFLCEESLNRQYALDAIMYTHNISKVFLPASYDATDARSFIHQQEIALSPHQRWENNVSEIRTPGWLQKDPRPMLWIGGPPNHRGVSWVSSFSTDIVDALELEHSAKIAYIFCNDGSHDRKKTPLFIFKKLILQLLKMHPSVLSVPANLEGLSIERFEEARDVPEQAFRILSDVLRMVDSCCQQEQWELFVLIDRVDICLAEENSQGRYRFLNALNQLNVEYKTLRIILTSQYPVGEISRTLGSGPSMTQVWVDTTRPAMMSSR